MAILQVYGFDSVNLSTAQTGNGDSTNIAYRGSRGTAGTVVLTSAVGATPTVTVNIQGSVDGVNWANVPYYSGVWVVAPTYIVTSFAITTAVTTMYHIRGTDDFRFLKLAYSANTNVTLTADAYF
jgi:hypothetical protein